jgi:hypothetical protein
MKQHNLICILFLVLFSCAKHASEQEKKALVVSDDFKSISIDLNIGEVGFSEVLEQIEVLGLEETKQSLVSGFGRLSLSSSQLVFADWESKDVFLYSKDGSFISKFNHDGDGPGEYKAIQSLWVEGDEIIIYDNVRRQMVRFDSDGKHLATDKINSDGADLIPVADGFLLDMVNRPTEDSLNFNVAVFDKHLKRTGLLNPFVGTLKFRIEPSGTLSTYKQGAIYTPVLNDSVFLIQNGESRPLLKFDFGEQWLWNDKELEGQNAINAIQNSDKVWQFSAKVGVSHAYVSYSVGFSNNGVLLISRSSGKYDKVKMVKNTQERFTIYPIQWEGDQLLFSLASYDLVELLNTLNDDQWKLIGDMTIQEIESSENPVLMWVKFKEEY